jgi:prepilin-type N-terminal cleavage/methylation domain-containing protein
MKTENSTPRTKKTVLQGSGGFTIIELVIATSIFAIIMLVAAAGILRFSTDYYKGVNGTNTQAVARAVINDVSQTLQFSSGMQPLANGAGSPTPHGYCIDSTMYSFAIGQQVAGSNHALLKTFGNCSGVTPSMALTPGLEHRELLAAKMRLSGLSIVETTPGSGMYSVKVGVIYGDDDLLADSTGKSPTDPAADWSTMHCKGVAGSQYCAVSRLSTTVQRRL